MTILSGLRDRIRGNSAASGHNGEGPGPAEAAPPYADYDGLDAREVMDSLSQHSQVELDATEGYERSHKNREQVLDKLRYMRGNEPFAGYDALETAEIVNALQDADMATIKKVRGYERKFANRPIVLDAVAEAHSRRLASDPDRPQSRR